MVCFNVEMMAQLIKLSVLGINSTLKYVIHQCKF